MSTSYHPQMDGQTKVVNRCMEGYLRCMAADRSSTWAHWLRLAEWRYNTTHHSTIVMPPSQAL